MEYQCVRCGYRWITRHNGKDNKVKPRSCAGCKSSLWDTPRKNKQQAIKKALPKVNLVFH
jgi:hypothetical protein